MPATSQTGIGKALRQARKERDLSIEEVAWRTRIRPEVLRGLEKEHFSSLGHHASVRTHLASYAKMLGLDAAKLVSSYTRVHEPVTPSSIASLDVQRKTSVLRRPRFRWVHAAVLAAAILAITSVAGVLRGPGAPPRVRSAAIPPGVSRIDRLDQASRSAGRAADAEHAVRGVGLGVLASAPTYVHVTVDGKPAFDGMLASGASRFFHGVAAIEIRTASAKTLRLWLNGSQLPAVPQGAWAAVFGPSGQLPA